MQKGRRKYFLLYILCSDTEHEAVPEVLQESLGHDFLQASLTIAQVSRTQYIT